MRRSLFGAFALIAAAQCGGRCVDGVTPDCSDGAPCGPEGILDGAVDSSTAPDDAASDAGRAADAADAADADADADG